MQINFIYPSGKVFYLYIQIKVFYLSQCNVKVRCRILYICGCLCNPLDYKFLKWNLPTEWLKIKTFSCNTSHVQSLWVNSRLPYSQISVFKLSFWVLDCIETTVSLFIIIILFCSFWEKELMNYMSLFQILTIIWIKLCKKIPHNRWLSMSHHRKSFKTLESCCSVGCLQHTLWSLKETRVD